MNHASAGSSRPTRNQEPVSSYSFKQQALRDAYEAESLRKETEQVQQGRRAIPFRMLKEVNATTLIPCCYRIFLNLPKRLRNGNEIAALRRPAELSASRLRMSLKRCRADKYAPRTKAFRPALSLEA
jgi:hypothetical protein